MKNKLVNRVNNIIVHGHQQQAVNAHLARDPMILVHLKRTTEQLFIDAAATQSTTAERTDCLSTIQLLAVHRPPTRTTDLLTRCHRATSIHMISQRHYLTTGHVRWHIILSS